MLCIHLLCQAGFNAGDNINYYMIEISGPVGIIDIETRSNIDHPGTWVFRVDGVDIVDAACQKSGMISTIKMFTLNSIISDIYSINSGYFFIAAICPPYKVIMVLNISPALDKLLISVLIVFREFLATGAQSTPGDKLFSCLFLSLPF